MLKIKKISDLMGHKVYTDSGEFFGEIEEANLIDNKVDGWRIRVNGEMSTILGGARGVIIPHQFVKAVGDVFIVTKTSLPSKEEVDLEDTGAAEVEGV